MLLDNNGDRGDGGSVEIQHSTAMKELLFVRPTSTNMRLEGNVSGDCRVSAGEDSS